MTTQPWSSITVGDIAKRSACEKKGVQEWIDELKAAGWVKWHNHQTAWQAPDGRIFRGPFKAWCIMTGNEHLLDTRIER